MAQSSTGDPIVMQLYRASGTNLISSHTALVLAQAVIEDVYGSQELELQRPLHVSDVGDAWVVRGSAQFGTRGIPKDQADIGAIEIVVAKFDGQILSLIREGQLTPP